jgi:hypothetical protein
MWLALIVARIAGGKDVHLITLTDKVPLYQPDYSGNAVDIRKECVGKKTDPHTELT